jgi:hypothetical protein
MNTDYINGRKQYIKQHNKPYAECLECLYLKSKCVLCKDAKGFFDRSNILSDTGSEILIEGTLLTTTNAAVSTRGYRATTQIRDGNSF